jgi:protein-tyrosine phosphatase
MAEGILKHKLAQRDLNNVEVDSAGFEPFHEGDGPDKRGLATMKKNGIDISGIRSRLFREEDFDDFDKIYVMDQTNYRDVMRMARNENDKKKVDLLLNQIHPGSNAVVPDPYYGGDEGFDTVFKLLSNACDNIVDKIEKSN